MTVDKSGKMWEPQFFHKMLTVSYRVIVLGKRHNIHKNVLEILILA